jgi:two-component system nitrate/nitrite response regulator NarP
MRTKNRQLECEEGAVLGGFMGNVVLFSDQPVMVYGLRAILAGSNYNFAGFCADFAGFFEIARQEQPDILLFDLRGELGVLRELTAVAPKTRIVLWMHDVSTELAYQALEMGVKGVVSTTASPEMLIRCLDGVAGGEMWMERNLTMNLLTTRPVALSRRQGELLRLLVQGLKNKEIASHLGISEGTVKAYMTRLFEKVGAKDRFELALFGLKNMSHLRAEPEQPRQGGLRSVVLARARHSA